MLVIVSTVLLKYSKSIIGLAKTNNPKAHGKPIRNVILTPDDIKSFISLLACLAKASDIDGTMLIEIAIENN